MERMQRNRESAMLSRQRKKMQLDELEQQNKQLQAANTHLSGVAYPATIILSLCKDIFFGMQYTLATLIMPTNSRMITCAA